MNVIDLFSGCGGLSLGFKTVGFNIYSHIESDEKAYRSAQRNVLSTSTINGNIDIREFESILKEGKTNIEPVDIVIGGPPCQAYSMAGRGKLASLMGVRNAHYMDNRGELYQNFLGVALAIKPKAILMENVPEILGYRGDDIPEKVGKILKDNGYHCAYTLLNAAEYGVPQFRERFFLIAVRKNAGHHPVFPVPTHRISIGKGGYRKRMNKLVTSGSSRFAVLPPDNNNPDLPDAITVGQALEDLPEISTLSGNVWKHKLDTELPYKRYPANSFAELMRTWPGFSHSDSVAGNSCRETIRDFPIFSNMSEGDRYPQALRIAEDLLLEKVKQFKSDSRRNPDPIEYELLRKATVPPYSASKFQDKWRMLEREKPSHTVVAHLSVDTYSHIHYDSKQARGITVREAARLQSFPDGFQFYGSLEDSYKQIGNAVPPLLAVHLANAIKKALH